MSFSQVKVVDFGKNKSGLLSVGYTIFNSDGSVNTNRVNSGIYEVSPGSGIYAAIVTFPDDHRGSILWDTGEADLLKAFAIEQYNVEENDPKLSQISVSVGQMSSSISLLQDVSVGRWKIADNQMIFFKSDNVTEVMRFNLFDENGVLSNVNVFDRRRT